jgi:hypothetical protein
MQLETRAIWLHGFPDFSEKQAILTHLLILFHDFGILDRGIFMLAHLQELAYSLVSADEEPGVSFLRQINQNLDSAWVEFDIHILGCK